MNWYLKIPIHKSHRPPLIYLFKISNFIKCSHLYYILHKNMVNDIRLFMIRYICQGDCLWQSFFFCCSTKEENKLARKLNKKKVIDELEKIAFHSVEDAIEIDLNNEISIKDINIDDKGIKTLEYSKGKFKITFYDKLKALDLLGKLLEKDSIKDDKNNNNDIMVNFNGISNYKKGGENDG